MTRKLLSGVLAFAMVFGCTAPVAMAEAVTTEVEEVEQNSLAIPEISVGEVKIGTESGDKVTVAIAKAVEDAKKNLVKVPVINTTIPHEQEARYGGAKVFMKPAAPGTGVKAGGAMRAVFESAGIQNVLAKSRGSSNPHNLVKATVQALTEMRDAYTVAGLRGIPMSKVFNG